MIRQKTWPSEGEAYFPCMSIIENLKIFLSETIGWMSVKFSKNVSLVTLYQDCSSQND